jgi:hypothetical protein
MSSESPYLHRVIPFPPMEAELVRELPEAADGRNDEALEPVARKRSNSTPRHGA